MAVPAYVLEVELSSHDRDAFYEHLLTCISSVDESEIHIIAGDFNGHIGEENGAFNTYHGGKGYAQENPEGLRL